jgi:hypothetical protein
MAISDLTITNSDLEGKKITDIVGDTLIGAPAENKAKFDAYSDVIKTRFNSLIDTLGEFLSSGGIGAGDLADCIKLILEDGTEYYVPKLDENNKIASKYIDDVSTEQKGLMSATDKTKLDTLLPTVSSISPVSNPPTSEAVYEAIGSISGVGYDWIVSQGTVDCNPVDAQLQPHRYAHWTYRKWNSGLAECMGYVIYNVQYWEQWGNLYYGTDYVNSTKRYYSYYYPTNLFKSGTNPSVVATAVTSELNSLDGSLDTAGVGIDGNTIGDNTKTPKMFVLRGTTGGTNKIFRINVHAYGVWK